MKIQWLGTAAAEGWPAVFCRCDACMRALRRGGRDIRMRSGALIDDTLLIDLNPDLYAQKLRFGLDLHSVRDILITHNHTDHMQPDVLDLMSRVCAGEQMEHVGIYGPSDAIQRTLPYIAYLDPHAVEAGDTLELQSGYRVTVLPALHSAKLGKFYLIEKGGKSILYAHDTDIFPDKAWEILQKAVSKPIDLVSLDCTNGPLPHDYIGHMGLAEDGVVIERLKKLGLADGHTRFFCNHFSHNGHLLYDELRPLAAQYGMDVTFDGCTAEF